MKAMILAAGMGDRMRPLTLETPKPLLEVGGKSLIIHQIEKLALNGFSDLVINHAWLGEKIEAALGNGEALGVSISWSREAEPLESAGGIFQALPLLASNADSSSFVCVNADIWTDYSFKNLPLVDGKTLLAWLVLVDNPEHNPDGDFVLADGKIWEAKDGEEKLTFSGIAVYHPALFDDISAGKQSIVPLLKQAMAKGKVGGEYYAGAWADIGTVQRLQTLDAKLKDKR